MFGVFGIDVSSFAIAGSFIIFLIAMEMILGIELFKQESLVSLPSVRPPTLSSGGANTCPGLSVSLMNAESNTSKLKEK